MNDYCRCTTMTDLLYIPPSAKFTLALCPGIANSSECKYMRSFAALAQSHGYRVAILNHLGALKSETLTAPRIFTYGKNKKWFMVKLCTMKPWKNVKCLILREHDYPNI